MELKFNKIFGIGLSRTGTSSLTYALRSLGFNIIHHPRPSFLPEMKQVIDDYDGATDSPIAYQFKALDILYPNSLFIYTHRQLNSWLASCERFLEIDYNQRTDHEIRRIFYGDYRFNERKFTQTYMNHNSNVLKYFKYRDDLLVLGTDTPNEQKMEMLCNFLHIPYSGQEYPHEHRGNI